MNRFTRRMVPVAVLALLMPLALVRAEPAESSAESGTVKGTVLHEDGTPAAGFEVRVMKAPAKKQNKTVEPDTSTPAPGGGAGGKREVVASGKTNDNGEFTLSVPAGEYVVMSGKAREGMGRQTVKVASGESVTVTLKLKKVERPNGGDGAGKKNK